MLMKYFHSPLEILLSRILLKHLIPLRFHRPLMVFDHNYSQSTRKGHLILRQRIANQSLLKLSEISQLNRNHIPIDTDLIKTNDRTDMCMKTLIPQTFKLH